MREVERKKGGREVERKVRGVREVEVLNEVISLGIRVQLAKIII